MIKPSRYQEGFIIFVNFNLLLQHCLAKDI